MRITDLLKKDGIVLGAAPADKRAAIDQLVALHEKCGNLLDVEAYKEGILKREEMGTTAIGMEIAIPHAKSEAVKAPALTALTVPDGVDYDSPDGMPCKLLFMIAATTDGDVHLEVLARMMQMLMDHRFRCYYVLYLIGYVLSYLQMVIFIEYMVHYLKQHLQIRHISYSRMMLS